MKRRNADLADEMALIRDQLVQAAGDGRIGQLEQGLRSLHTIFESWFSHAAQIDQQMPEEQRRTTWSDGLTQGRVGSTAISTTLAPVALSALQAQSPDPIRIVLDATSGLLTVAWNQREMEAAKDVLGVFRLVASRVAEQPDAHAPVIRPTYVLRELGSVLDRVWRQPNDSPDDAPLRFTEIVLAAMADSGKYLIDHLQDAAFEEWTAAFGQAFRRMLLPTRERVELGELEVRVQATYLALLGWIIYREANAEVEGRPVLNRMLEANSNEGWPEATWRASVASNRGSGLSEALGWTWWEIDLRKPMQVGTMVFDRYFRASVLSQLLVRWEARSALESASEADPTESEAAEARLLRNALQSESPPVPGKAAHPSEGAEVSRLLDLIISADERGRRQALADADLDPARVDQMRAAAARVLAEGEGLSGFLAHRVPDDAELFGIHLRVPKYYFADSDVHASPEELGSEFGHAIVRGESEHILRTLEGHTEATPYAGSDIAAQIVEALGRHEDDAEIIVVRDFEAWRALSDQALGSDRYHRGLTETFSFEGRPCHFVSEGEREAVLVGALRRAAAFGRVRPEGSPDELTVRVVEEPVERRDPEADTIYCYVKVLTPPRITVLHASAVSLFRPGSDDQPSGN